jgi:acyl-CoA synthetase (AMP-forming)/AMP-acid ligase II/alkylation response protein AidB-like acyl-CoA dehydrogenase/acyl carrier protein
MPHLLTVLTWGTEQLRLRCAAENLRPHRLIACKGPAYSWLLSNASPGRKANTFTDMLLSRAAAHGDRRAFTFLRDGELEEATLTYGELHRRALAVANELSSICKRGDRAILLYPPGFDFIVSFFGCLYAGVIPVPVSVPNRKRGIEIVRGVVIDAGAQCILSVDALLSKFGEILALDPALGRLPRFETENWTLSGNPAQSPQSQPDDIALLQYTSGSTGSPRGVVVTHANLVDNHQQHALCFGHDSSTVAVSWLPMFHDMGLGTVLGALWLGVECVLMAPTAFLQKPVRWLQAISRYGATSSGGPDFAYDLCVRRITREESAGLDLSSWRVAYNGSEPVRASTLNRFSETFAPYGFKREAFHPVYGLAEATLFVSGEDVRTPPVVRKFSRDALERGSGTIDATGSGQSLVSCGSAWLGGRISVVNPDTLTVCTPGQIGEIWVGGPSVALGYWKKPEETQATFQARTAAGDGPFLRTGDLGFSHEGRLFVTGRSKDMIIVRGRNHYPQDIETTLADTHPALEPLACAAFSVESEDGEQVVIVQEVRRTAVHRLEPEAVFRAIRSGVADHHGLHAHAIMLISPGTLLRTTSGKVRRKACRQAFLEQTLAVLAASVFGAEAVEAKVEMNEAGEAAVVPTIPGKPHDQVAGAVTGRRLSAELAAKAADTVIEWLRRYADNSNEPQASDVLRKLSPALLKEFASQGLLGMQVGTEHGGLGLGHAETARVLEQLAAIDLNAGLFVGLNNYLGVGPIIHHAQPRMRDVLLPRLARGGELAGFAFAEPGAGSNPEALASHAEPINGSGWRLFGNKYTSGGSAGSGVINVFVRHADRDGVSAFVVPQDTMGLNRSSKALASGTQGLARSRISLDGVALKNDHVLGRPGDGMAIALDAMGHARLAVAAACLGGMKRCAQLVFHFATQRQTSTGRLVAHPVTLAKLGRVTAGVTALECLVQQVARAADRGYQVPTEAFTVCKVAAPEMLWQVVDDLVQLLGRRGYVETPHIRHLVRDAQALRSCEGPTEAMSALLGARLMNGGQEATTRLAVEVFGAPSVGPLVEQAVGAVRARSKRATAGPPRDAVYWSHARAGELTTWLSLLAAVEGCRKLAPGVELDRAATWARANYERTLSLVQTESPLDAAGDDTGISEAVAAYSRSIGAADPLMMWDEQALHPLLSVQDTESGEPSSERGRAPDSQRPAAGVSTRRPSGPPSRHQLRAWVVAWLAQRLRVAQSQIDPNRSFADHGIDSLTAVELAKALSDQVGHNLDETLLWNFPTIDALIKYLQEQQELPETRRSPSSSTPPPPGPAGTLDDEIAKLEQELKRR